MKRLALITPWPPQHTGIADYAFELASTLVDQGLEITVYTTEQKPFALAGVELKTVADGQALPELASYDSIVYQLGNNTNFHLWMIPLLSRHPGVVHLHDMVMHHMAAWITWMQGDAEGYLHLLGKWYGNEGLENGRRSLEQANYLWDSDRVTEYPLCEEYLQYAKAVIVHSEFAQIYLRKRCPHLLSFQVPQYYCVEPRAQVSHQLRRISVLGGVDPQKRLDWVLGSLSELRHRNSNHPAVELHIVGSIDSRCEYLQDVAQTLIGKGLNIQFHGRLDEGEFKTIFEQTDLCIALRHPTMGETSAIVMRALQLGVPTIVNNLGWYAELPDDLVKKLSIEECQAELSRLLEYLLMEPGAYEEWSSHCHQYASSQFSMTDCARRYIEICENPGGVEKVSEIFAATLRECGLNGSDGEDALLETILTESYF